MIRGILISCLLVSTLAYGQQAAVDVPSTCVTSPHPQENPQARQIFINKFKQLGFPGTPSDDQIRCVMNTPPAGRIAKINEIIAGVRAKQGQGQQVPPGPGPLPAAGQIGQQGPQQATQGAPGPGPGPGLQPAPPPPTRAQPAPPPPSPFPETPISSPMAVNIMSGRDFVAFRVNQNIPGLIKLSENDKNQLGKFVDPSITKGDSRVMNCPQSCSLRRVATQEISGQSIAIYEIQGLRTWYPGKISFGEGGIPLENKATFANNNVMVQHPAGFFLLITLEQGAYSKFQPQTQPTLKCTSSQGCSLDFSRMAGLTPEKPIYTINGTYDVVDKQAALQPPGNPLTRMSGVAGFKFLVKYHSNTSSGVLASIIDPSNKVTQGLNGKLLEITGGPAVSDLRPNQQDIFIIQTAGGWRFTCTQPESQKQMCGTQETPYVFLIEPHLYISQKAPADVLNGTEIVDSINLVNRPIYVKWTIQTTQVEAEVSGAKITIVLPSDHAGVVGQLVRAQNTTSKILLKCVDGQACVLNRMNGENFYRIAGNSIIEIQ